MSIKLRQLEVWLVAGLVLFGVSGCAVVAHRPQVDSTASNTVVIPYQDNLYFEEGLPAIQASVNGATGSFLLDTGANVPLLSKRGLERFRLTASEKAGKQIEIYYDPKAKFYEVKNVTVDLGSGVKIKWSKAYVDEQDQPWCGIIDYRTLKALRAEIHTGNKTIVIPKPISK